MITKLSFYLNTTGTQIYRLKTTCKLTTNFWCKCIKSIIFKVITCMRSSKSFKSIGWDNEIFALSRVAYIHNIYTYIQTEITVFSHLFPAQMWHRGPKPVACRFWLFYWIIICTAFASKYFLQYQNILFLTEVILVWLEQSKKWKKLNKKFKIFRVIIIVRSHYFIILKLPLVIKGFILYQIR